MDESRQGRRTTVSRQCVYWLLTIPVHEFTPYLPPGVSYIRGQLERGEGGFVHWQLLAVLSRKQRLSWLRTVFGTFHAEPSRSDAADAYVWKEETRIEGTQFEIGVRPFKRNSATDWDSVWVNAVSGNLLEIPADIRVRCYSQLRRITGDFGQPVAMERETFVFWGPTGTGKSRRAWEEATLEAYPKDPRTKFWCGYRGQECVVVDEFRGGIDIAHLLRWLDRYPCIVETKGGSVVLAARRIYLTSNLHPDQWFPECDEETRLALKRRLQITQFHNPL